MPGALSGEPADAKSHQAELSKALREKAEIRRMAPQSGDADGAGSFALERPAAARAAGGPV